MKKKMYLVLDVKNGNADGRSKSYEIGGILEASRPNCVLMGLKKIPNA